MFKRFGRAFLMVSLIAIICSTRVNGYPINFEVSVPMSGPAEWRYHGEDPIRFSIYYNVHDANPKASGVHNVAYFER